jgi:hypothetical protein
MSLPLSLSLIYHNFLTSISSIDLGVLIFFIGYVCVHLIVLIWIFLVEDLVILVGGGDMTTGGDKPFISVHPDDLKFICKLLSLYKICMTYIYFLFLFFFR